MSVENDLEGRVGPFREVRARRLLGCRVRQGQKLDGRAASAAEGPPALARMDDDSQGTFQCRLDEWIMCAEELPVDPA